MTKNITNMFIGVDGSVKQIYPEKKDFTLQEMYKIIGCELVEMVQLSKGVEMWVDEEGLLKEHPIENTVATAYYRKAYPHADPDELLIVGNAIIQDKTKAQAFFFK